MLKEDDEFKKRNWTEAVLRTCYKIDEVMKTEEAKAELRKLAAEAGEEIEDLNPEAEEDDEETPNT